MLFYFHLAILRIFCKLAKFSQQKQGKWSIGQIVNKFSLNTAFPPIPFRASTECVRCIYRMRSAETDKGHYYANHH